MADARDLTVSELREILRMRGLSTTGNKTELVLTIEEANTDGSWLRNCENNNPLLQEAYE